MKTDQEIQREVLAALHWEPTLHPDNITVAVHRGIVTLIGTVSSFYERLTAEELTRRVRCVRSVIEDLRISLPKEMLRTDHEILRAGENALQSHTVLQGHTIKIKVENSHITLDGDVDWQYQKDLAFDAVKSITGVKAISNFLFVKPALNAAIIKEDIEQALYRMSEFRDAEIEVRISESRVTLEGKVHTWLESKLAEHMAWASPGVTKVLNKLEIN